MKYLGFTLLGLALLSQFVVLVSGYDVFVGVGAHGLATLNTIGLIIALSGAAMVASK